MKLLLRHKFLSGLFVLLSLVYLVQSAFLSPDTDTLNKYHLSNGKLIIASLTVVLPYIIIWFVALSGYLRLRSYTNTIASAPDGKAFNLICHGLLGLTIWLPLSAIISSFTTREYRFHHSYAVPLVWFRNYSVLLLLFVSFGLLFLGARKLVALLDRPQATVIHHSAIGLYAGFAMVYALVIVHDPARQMPVGDVKLASYYLSNWLIIVTILIPRIIMWYLGLKAVQYIYMYRNEVAGTIYRQSLENVASGLAFVVVSAITLRYFDSMAAQINQLSFAGILILVYLLLALIAVGYVLIARGARKLQRIEES